MIKNTLTNPQILQALASNGHGSKILIADGNFPAGTMTPSGSLKVYLNVKKDLPKVDDVLECITSTVNIESATIMGAPDGTHQPIHDVFKRLLGEIPFTTLTRVDFYEAARSQDTYLVIVTGETRRFANVILTTGVYV